MNERMILLRSKAVRWFLLLLGLGAIIALTGMNVYSLYGLRDQMIEGEEERRMDQLEEITQSIRLSLLEPLIGLYKIDLENVETSIEKTGQFPKNVQEKLYKASQYGLYTGIYYTPEQTDPCDENAKVYKYNYETHKIFLTSEYPDLLCEGVDLVRTKTRIQLSDLSYRWNNNVEFDTHRSVNISLINQTEGRIMGYLTFPMDEDYIINEIISPMLSETFKPSEKSGIVVWLRSRVNDEIILSTDPEIEFSYDLVDHTHRFSSYLNNWRFHVSFLTSPVYKAYNASLIKNLVVLGVAVLFLVGALIFMFVTAQRERNLASLQANFLANVTHELKTPLAVMQAAGENISDGRVTEAERLKQYGNHIYNESIRLRKMIEKLLDVARVDAGQVILKPTPNNIYTLLSKYITENREFIEGKGFEIRFYPKDKVSNCLIDEDSFETIVSNLTENALKYTIEDKVIEYSISSDAEYVYMSIHDRGIGIPKKAMKNIFNKFYRVENPLSAKTKGHGLGLSIVKNLVDLNGGEISVSSDLGIGSTFIVRFPKLVADISAAESSPQDASHNYNRNTEYVG